MTKMIATIAATNPKTILGTKSSIKRSKFPIIAEKQNTANDTHMAYSAI